MKKLLLISLLLGSITLVMAQKIKEPLYHLPYESTMGKYIVAPDQNLKADGDIFFTETFDFADPANPRGWTLPDGWTIVDEQDFGHYWVWRAGTDSLRGRFTFEKGHQYSKTPEDGFFVLPIDEYNWVDGVDLGINAIAWFQMAPIDCSGHSSVIFKMRQYFRSCCNAPSATMLVSNDQGVHWAEYSMLFGTPTNNFCKRPYVEVNITEVAAGMSDVWIKFLWNNNRYYFWAIDDIELSEGYRDELQLEDSWVYMSDLYPDDGDEGYVYMTPLEQINDLLGGWTFKGAFMNFGRDDQYECHLNAEVFKNGTSVYNENSSNRDIWAVDRDTFDVTTPYFPDDYGSYKFALTASQEQQDMVPGNNSYSDIFHVSDSVYSHADWTSEYYSSTASWGNNDGDYLGMVYDITKATQVNSMSVYIMQRIDNPRASTQVGYGFQYFLFRWDEEIADWVEMIPSEYTEVTEEMINNWVTLPMEKDGESEFMEPGQYLAVIQVWHGGGMGPDNNIYRFTIGNDLSHKYGRNKSVYKLIDGDTWYINTTACSMIRLNIDHQGAPSTGNATFNVDMNLPIANGYFNPSTEFVDVAGSFNGWNGSAHMTDPDGDGVYTLTVSDLPVFQNIEYKYRINANWNTSEFPSGGPNRVLMTSFFTETNDVYNNGISMGVGQNPVESSIAVYPNPSEGMITIDIQNQQSRDLNITITSLNGQVVYHKELKNVMQLRENIDLTGLAKGIYMLRANDQVQKLIVK